MIVNEVYFNKNCDGVGGSIFGSIFRDLILVLKSSLSDMGAASRTQITLSKTALLNVKHCHRRIPFAYAENTGNEAVEGHFRSISHDILLVPKPSPA